MVIDTEILRESLYKIIFDSGVWLILVNKEV